MSPALRGGAAAALPSSPAPAAAPSRRMRPGVPRLRLATVTSGRSAASVFGTAALVLLFMAVLGVVVFQTFLVQTQSHLDQLDEQVRVERERADDLRLRLAELQSPERIVAEAQDRLGMVAPDEVLYLQNDVADDTAARLDPAEQVAATAVAPTPGTSSGGGSG